jgi:hypothetical protein
MLHITDCDRDYDISGLYYVAYYRLDKVIEELDNIKDNVSAREKMLGMEQPPTARSTSLGNIDPEIYSVR